jgi:predicted RNase H-like HicB family nuclease
MRQVLVYRGEDGYWIAEVPSLPGCISQGDTRDETLKNIQEAMELYLEELRDGSEDSPPE